MDWTTTIVGSVDWTTAFGTVLTGLVVVFIALILLILLLTLFRNVFGSLTHKEEAKPAPKPVRAPAPAAPAKPAPVILSDDEGEIAAAITAALAVDPGGGRRRQDLRLSAASSVSAPAAAPGAPPALRRNVRPF